MLKHSVYLLCVLVESERQISPITLNEVLRFFYVDDMVNISRTILRPTRFILRYHLLE